MYHRAFTLDPTGCEYYMSMARALRRAGQLDEAARTFAMVCRVEPDSVDMHVEFGAFQVRVSCFAFAPPLPPTHPPLSPQLDHRRLAGAVSAYGKALALDPGCVQAALGLGRALELAGRPSEALAMLNRANASTVHPDLLCATGEAVCAEMEHRRRGRDSGGGGGPHRDGPTLVGSLVQGLEGSRLLEAVSDLVAQQVTSLHTAVLEYYPPEDPLPGAEGNTDTAVPPPPAEPEAKAAYARAAESALFADAMAAFSSCLELRPAHARARAGVCRALRLQRRHPEAVESAKEALAADAGCAEAYYQMGLTLLDPANAATNASGDGDAPLASDGLAALAACAELAPGHAAAQEALGRALAKRGRYVESISAFTTAAVQWPDFFEAYAGLGGSLRREARHAEAVGALKTALSLDPANARVWGELGAELRVMGKPGQAAQAFRASLEVAPGDHAVLYALGASLEEDGEYGQAIDAFASANRAVMRGRAAGDIDVDYTFRLGSARVRHFRTKHAALANGPPPAKSAAAPSPHDDVSPAVDPSEAAEATGKADLRRAVPELEAVLVHDPSHFAARRALATALHECGQRAAAVLEYEAVLRVAPDLTEVVLALAKCVLDSGRPVEAGKILSIHSRRRAAAAARTEATAVEAVFDAAPLGIDLAAQAIAGESRVVVSRVVPGSRGDAQGVAVGDVLREVAGYPVPEGTSTASVAAYISDSFPVAVSFLRRGGGGQKSSEAEDEEAVLAGAVGEVLRNQGHTDEAAECYRRGLSTTRPADPAMTVGLGTCLEARGKVGCEGAAFLSPSPHPPLLSPALLSTQLDDAVACYAAVVSTNPHHCAALYNLGGAVAVRGGEMDRALALLRKACAANPYDADARIGYAAVLAAGGAHRAALSNLRAACAVDPDHAEGRAQLGDSLVANRLPTEATAAYVDEDAAAAATSTTPACYCSCSCYYAFYFNALLRLRTNASLASPPSGTCTPSGSARATSRRTAGWPPRWPHAGARGRPRTPPSTRSSGPRRTLRRTWRWRWRCGRARSSRRRRRRARRRSRTTSGPTRRTASSATSTPRAAERPRPWRPTRRRSRSPRPTWPRTWASASRSRRRPGPRTPPSASSARAGASGRTWTRT